MCSKNTGKHGETFIFILWNKMRNSCDLLHMSGTASAVPAAEPVAGEWLLPLSPPARTIVTNCFCSWLRHALAISANYYIHS